MLANAKMSAIAKHPHLNPKASHKA